MQIRIWKANFNRIIQILVWRYFPVMFLSNQGAIPHMCMASNSYHRVKTYKTLLHEFALVWKCSYPPTVIMILKYNFAGEPHSSKLIHIHLLQPV